MTSRHLKLSFINESSLPREKSSSRSVRDSSGRELTEVQHKSEEEMRSCTTSIIAFVVGACQLAAAFTAPGSLQLAARTPTQLREAQAVRAPSPVAVVVDISSTEEFNDALASAGDSLVVVDYSTSWCGPCKIIAPKFDEFSERYKSVSFLKVMGDSSPAADKLMRSQGVRALPSFHFWKNNKQIDSISGAKTQALQDAIEANM